MPVTSRIYHLALTCIAAVTAACASSSVDEPLPPGPPAFVNSSGGRTTAVRAANGALIRELPMTGGSCSPDATRLIITSSVGARSQAHIWNLDGSPVRTVTVPVDNGEAIGTTWSPDAIRLAVAYVAYGATVTTRIFLMNADGSGGTHVPNAAPGGSGLSWSPDGTELLFTTIGPGSILVAVNIASGATRAIATNVLQARWSPDGSYIGIVDWGNGTDWPISVVNRDGTGRRLVTTARSMPIFTWTPDGRMLYGDMGTLTFLNVNNGAKTPLNVSQSGFHSDPHWCGTP